MSSLKTSTLPKHNVFASRRYGCYPEKPVTVFACFLFSGLTTSFPASAGPTHNMWFVEMKQPTLKKGKRKTKAKAFRSLAQEKKRKHCIHQISRHTFFFFFTGMFPLKIWHVRFKEPKLQELKATPVHITNFHHPITSTHCSKCRNCRSSHLLGHFDAFHIRTTAS